MKISITGSGLDYPQYGQQKVFRLPKFRPSTGSDLSSQIRLAAGIIGGMGTAKMHFDGCQPARHPYLKLREEVEQSRVTVGDKPALQLSTSYFINEKRTPTFMHGSTSVRCYEFHTRELFEAFANQLGEQVKTYLGKALAKMPTDTVINVAVGLDESNRPILAVEVLLMGVQSTYRLT